MLIATTKHLAPTTTTDLGSSTIEHAYKLCGDHSEHVYEATRLTTHGSQCTSVMWSTDADLLIGSTTGNYIGARLYLLLDRVWRAVQVA